MYCANIIIGAGPSALQLAYFFKKQQIEYLILEKENSCASFFEKYPISNKLISLNKKYTGEADNDFNIRHDWNSLLNDENFLFTDFSDELYPTSTSLHEYLNKFAKKFELNIVYNTNVLTISKNNDTYEIQTNDTLYKCDKLIMATGLSKPNYPKNIKILNEIKIKHYCDFNKNFTDNEVLKTYINKQVLIIGGGNAGYELANMLEKYCSTVIILGSNKNLSIVSHYVGDIRTVYLPFLDTFYLKSLNGIDQLDKNSQLTISYDNGKYYLRSSSGATFYNGKISTFDEIILCTGWVFDKTIFNFDISTTINDKYPSIKPNFESTNNPNLYFIGSLMHSKDYRKGSGGFIHGFRYLLKLFMQLNYDMPKIIHEFKFTGNMDCYEQLTKHIFRRINYSSSLYQLYGTMGDIFYFDKNTNNIVYIQDWTRDCVKYLNLKDNTNINLLIFEYGQEETIIKRLGSFNKWNPSFLHPRIYMLEYKSTNDFTLLDRIIFEENLIADFSAETIYNKIVQVLKMCNLII